MQPAFKQTPPSRLRSTNATFAPALTASRALSIPAYPPPRITRLYLSAGRGLIHASGWTLFNKLRLPASSASTEGDSVSIGIGFFQPSSRKAGPFQSGPDIGAIPHQVPNKLRSVIFDHQHHQALIQAEITFRHPAELIAGTQCRIQSTRHSTALRDSRILFTNISNSRQSSFWFEGQRSKRRRRRDGPVIWPPGRATGRVTEKL